MTVYRWKKKENTGAHYFKYDNKKYRITPGKIVDCTIVPIGPFVEQYDCLGEINGEGNVVAVKEEKKEAKGDITLEVVSKGYGYYDVINPENPDKPINDKKLRKKEAYMLAGLPIPKEKAKRVRKK